MARQRYCTVDDVVNALREGWISRRGCSEMMRYYRDDPEKLFLYKEAMRITKREMRKVK